MPRGQAGHISEALIDDRHARFVRYSEWRRPQPGGAILAPHQLLLRYGGRWVRRRRGHTEGDGAWTAKLGRRRGPSVGSAGSLETILCPSIAKFTI